MKSGTKTTLRVLAWSASTVLLIGAAAETATAATHHAKHKKAKHATSSTDAGSTPRAGGPGGPGGPGPMNVLHGTATVENSDGTFETYLTQHGKVTAVSATSITLVSDDEFSATYAIDDDTVVFKDGAKGDAGDVAEGDTVFVRAEQESDGATAEVIGDGKPPAGKPHPGGPGGPGGRGPGVPPPAAE